jgi:hypothetical protein
MGRGRNPIIVPHPSLERFVRYSIKTVVDAGLQGKIGKSMGTAKERIGSIGGV